MANFICKHLTGRVISLQLTLDEPTADLAAKAFANLLPPQGDGRTATIVVTPEVSRVLQADQTYQVSWGVTVERLSAGAGGEIR